MVRREFVEQSLRKLYGPEDTEEPEFRPESDVLCSICHNIVQKSDILAQQAREVNTRKEGVERWPHHKDIEALLRSAQHGCHLCTLLYTQLIPFDFEEMERPTEALTLRVAYVTISRGGKSLKDVFKFGIENPDGEDRVVGLSQCNPVNQEEAEMIASNRKVDHSWRTCSTGSEATLDVARAWVNTCRNGHRQCLLRGSTPRLRPTRFLDLSKDTEGKLLVRLHNLTEKDLNREYIALSHCWGRQLPLRLLRSNYESFLHNIPLSELPKTFHDAADITVRLGFDAIWIDALCIIQDDIDQRDWKFEASRMGCIYGNAFCSIAALTSPGSDSGCYARRLPLMWEQCKLRLAEGSIVYLEAPRAWGLADNIQPTQMGGCSYAPILHTRGWVVQERALCPRTLYFSSIGIHWECRTCNAWEQRPNMHYFETRSNTFMGSQILKYGIARALRAEKQTLTDWHDNWWRLVATYTRCNLTHPTDRWPAIAGIADILQTVVKYDLIAGPWQQELTKDLLWEIASEAGGRLENGQPSWSWTSITSAVRCNPEIRDKGSRIVAKVNLEDLKTSKYRGAHNRELFLRIEAPMVKCRIQSSFQLSCWIDTSDTTIAYHPEVVSKDIRHAVENGFWHPDVKGVEFNEDVWVMQILNTRHSIHGLVIKPSSDSDRRWHRIGRFSARFKNAKATVFGDSTKTLLY